MYAAIFVHGGVPVISWGRAVLAQDCTIEGVHFDNGAPARAYNPDELEWFGAFIKLQLILDIIAVDAYQSTILKSASVV